MVPGTDAEPWPRSSRSGRAASPGACATGGFGCNADRLQLDLDGMAGAGMEKGAAESMRQLDELLAERKAPGK
jgi:hypothetical protein